MRTLWLIVLLALSFSADAAMSIRDPFYVSSLSTASGASAAVTNILYDTFDDGPAGPPLGATRTAYPGPGVWTNNELNSSQLMLGPFMSVGVTQIVANALTWLPQPAGGNFTNTMMMGPAVTNCPGLTMISKFMPTGNSTSTNQSIYGFERNTITNNPDGGSIWMAGITPSLYASGTKDNMGSVFDPYFDYETAVVTRPTGAYYFIRGGLRNGLASFLAYSDWVLWYVHYGTNDAWFHPCLASYGSSNFVDSVRVFNMSQIDPAWATNDWLLATNAVLGSVASNSSTYMPPNSTVEFTYRQGDTNFYTDILKVRMSNPTNGWVLRGHTNKMMLIKLVDGAETVLNTASWGGPQLSNSYFRVIASCWNSNIYISVQGNAATLGAGNNQAFSDSFTNVYTGTDGSNLVVWPMYYTFPSYSGVSPVKGIWSFGDSKVSTSHDTQLPVSNFAPNWQYYLCQILNSNANAMAYGEVPVRAGHTSYSVAQLSNIIDADLAACVRQVQTPPVYALISMGINDCGTTIDQNFTNGVYHILDAIHAKWPTTKVYISNVWQTNACMNIVGISNTLYGATSGRESWCFHGVDEVPLIIFGQTDDGTHLTHPGCVAEAVAWKLVLGL